MAASLSSCKKDSDDVVPNTSPDLKEFTLNIENVSKVFDNKASGSFTIPKGATKAGGIPSDGIYEFSFNANPGDYLSFATMLVATNDLFFAPKADGLALFDKDGKAVVGDITDQIKLWDAGTEVNQEPGKGDNQPQRSAGVKNKGEVESGTVKLIADVSDGFTYPAVNELVEVTLNRNTEGMFTLSIKNISKSSSLDSPLAPGVWAVHEQGKYPLFETGKADFGMGLEALAEEGDVANLAEKLKMNSGINNLLAPGLVLVHKGGVKPLFMENEKDLGLGLEALAEDGNPLPLFTSFLTNKNVSQNLIFNQPVGKSAPGPLASGGKYQVKFKAQPGDRLQFATMLVQTNDLFYAFEEGGVELFKNGVAISGDLSSEVELWDSGTEENETFGFGMYQAPRQGKPNKGTSTAENVVEIDESTGRYPKNTEVVKLTIN